jgi:hypothetical protein
MNCQSSRLFIINERREFMRKAIIFLALAMMPGVAAEAQQTGSGLQREVKLYNPFKPSLSEANKKNYMPDMNDTTTIRPAFTYTVSPTLFNPVYTISPIRPATLVADPLPKLYKSFLTLGMGNYFTPLGELTIASERSRTGMMAFNVKHFSSNGKVQLQNLEKVTAGYMDNEASFYGKKFYNASVLSGSVDFAHLTRHAYGYDTSFVGYEADRDDIRLRFMDAGANIGLSSLRADSGRLIYDARIGYDYFRQSTDLWQHNANLSFEAGKRIKALRSGGPRAQSSDFYAKLRGDYSLTILDKAVDANPRHLVTLNPSLGKKSNEWSFNLGFNVVTETRTFDVSGIDEYKTKLHIYPDVNLEIAVIPSFLNFNIALDGRLEDSSAPNMVRVNPFLQTDGSLFSLPYTNHEITARAGLSGSVIPSTTYRLGGSYSVFSDMVFFSNIVWEGLTVAEGYGSFFTPVISEGSMANLYAQINTAVTTKISTVAKVNYYNYSLTSIDFPYNKPSWDGSLWVKYNLRDKIIAGASLNALGPREVYVTKMTLLGPPALPDIFTLPAHFNLSLSAEYRYTKILSFWLKVNNISTNRYYEWAYYPSQRFLMMAGFSYSL